jgi:hypothetical protein
MLALWCLVASRLTQRNGFGQAEGQTSPLDDPLPLPVGGERFFVFEYNHGRL